MYARVRVITPVFVHRYVIMSLKLRQLLRRHAQSALSPFLNGTMNAFYNRSTPETWTPLLKGVLGVDQDLFVRQDRRSLRTDHLYELAGHVAKFLRRTLRPYRRDSPPKDGEIQTVTTTELILIISTALDQDGNHPMTKKVVALFEALDAKTVQLPHYLQRTYIRGALKAYMGLPRCGKNVPLLIAAIYVVALVDAHVALSKAPEKFLVKRNSDGQLERYLKRTSLSDVADDLPFISAASTRPWFKNAIRAGTKVNGCMLRSSYIHGIFGEIVEGMGTQPTLRLCDGVTDLMEAVGNTLANSLFNRLVKVEFPLRISARDVQLAVIGRFFSAEAGDRFTPKVPVPPAPDEDEQYKNPDEDALYDAVPPQAEESGDGALPVTLPDAVA